MSEKYNPWELNTYHLKGELPWQDEEYGVPLRVGDGFVDASNKCRRFRVIDVWYSTDDHGALDYGRHVVLEEVSETDDDLPAKLYPDYYRG